MAEQRRGVCGCIWINQQNPFLHCGKRENTALLIGMVVDRVAKEVLEHEPVILWMNANTGTSDGREAETTGVWNANSSALISETVPTTIASGI